MANKIWVSEQRLGYYHGKLVTLVDAKDAAALAAAKAYADGLADNYEAAGSVKTAQDALQANIDAEKQRAEGVESGLAGRLDVVEGDVGTMDNLATNAKGDLVSAINEVRSAVSAGGTAAAISIDTSVTTDGALKSYALYQGDSKIGVIDIPKDMVVESGEVVTNPEGQAEGTYIKLVLANVAEPLFINVGTLVDIYKAKANAAQVQVTIDANSREISAAIVAGSIGTTELADDSITTVKIVDNNVTKAKLSTTLQASIDKADAAAPQTALDTEKQRAEAAEAKALEDANKHSDELNTAMDTRMQVVEGKAHEHANAEELAKIAAGDKAKWDAAEQNAKDYADGLVAGVDLSGIAANAAAIEALTGTHGTDKAALEAKDTELQGAINTLSQTHGTDKAALEAKDTELQGNIDALAQTHATDKAALEQSVTDLEASFVEITEATIDGWFAEA